MASFYLMTKSGTTPPKYLHHSLETAITEAKRLNEMLSDEVFILEVVGRIVTEQVPVTKNVQRTILKECLGVGENDDLPF